jgi:hypothetical protein
MSIGSVMEELKTLLIRMSDSANAAQAYYQIWFTLRGQGKAIPEYYDDMNDYRYVDFFHAINSGNYKLIFLELGCIFDSDTRTASFRNLKTALAAEGHNDIVNDINCALAPFSALVASAITIRAKLIAHKEIGAFSTEVHQSNSVIPNEIGNLINVSCNLINDINIRLFGTRSCLLATTTDRFERATFQMLEVLRRGRS